MQAWQGTKLLHNTMDKTIFQKNFFPLIPEQPGIYRYYSADKKLLYVGKAKNLKKRVSSYFSKNHTDSKLLKLVSLIQNIEWTLTGTEHDAFLMENSLIKHFKPPFNIRLKDDKAYPFLVIKKEPFPRVFLTRQKLKDGAEYLGPFTTVGAVYEMLKVIKASIPLRTCALPLNVKNIQNGKFKACLEYHIGNCNAPCIGLQTEEAYLKNVQYIRDVFKGNIGTVVLALKQQMQDHVAALEFEKAQVVKMKLDQLKNYQSQSSVVSSHVGNVDVATIIVQSNTAFVHFMVVVDGRVLHSKNEIIKLEIDTESPEDILSHVAAQMHALFQSEAKELITHLPVATLDPNIEVVLPKSGFKKKLLDLSFKNNEFAIQSQKKKASLVLKQHTEEAMADTLLGIQDALHMSQYPDHIECFDNSNFQGAFPVAAMVCFKDGLPFKAGYRRFHIKTVAGINDFASMAEIVYRRYSKVLANNEALPKLIIIDGGKGQLSAAMESIKKLDLVDKVTVIGLAKREELIFMPGQSEPINLPFNSPELLLIRSIRDEVHRFGITFHRETRSKGTIKNELEDIKGIGNKTAQTLLQHFRSVAKIKAATLDDLHKIIDHKKAQLIYHHFHTKQST